VTVSLFRVHFPGIVLLAALIAIGAWLYVRAQRGQP
jgi:hypothetical protein